jgi:hypothetical protein
MCSQLPTVHGVAHTVGHHPKVIAVAAVRTTWISISAALSTSFPVMRFETPSCVTEIV